MDRKKSLSRGNYQSHRDDILRRARGEVSGLTNDISNINAEKEQEIITIVDKPVKLGDSSIVEFITDDISYSYERGADKVSFSCSGIENISGSSTGLLSLCCWISEKSLENGLWQNENHSLVDIVELGSLDNEEAFLDINQTFNISDENLVIINQRNIFYAEWHFIFTINELNEDGNAYIINTINGSNENEGRRLPLSDESLTIIGSNEQLIVHINNEEFTGVLYSSDERYEIFVEDSEATSIVLYHKNGNIAEIVSKDEKKTFDEEGNEIKEGLFISRYGDEFDETISKASEELDNNMRPIAHFAG